MKLVSRTGRCPAQIEAFAEPGQCPPLCAGITFVLAYDLLELSAEKTADGAALFGSHDSGFAQEIGIEFKRDIGFHLDIPR